MSAERCTLDTHLGRLVGLRGGGVARYSGIRYALAPVGERRFRAPVAAGGWSGELDATPDAAAQPQSTAGPELVPGMRPARVDDDSLTLTIWAPDGAGPRPVLVWIHGGSFTIGSSSLPTYEATRLAADGGVVVVAINYRLGALGFMTVDGAANLGLLDQVCALQWVRDHIGEFGGDPRNVTVFGESAGGGSLLHLLAMPAAAGLFEQAIVQSGSTGRTLSSEQAAAITEIVLAELGCGPGDLARVTSSEVVAAQERAMPKLFGIAGLLPFHPALDDATLPSTPLDALRAGAARTVDLVLGVTADEMRLFLDGPALEPARLHKRAARYLGLDDAATTALLDAYASLLDAPGPIDVWAALYTDKEMLVPSIAALDAHSASGGRTFAYRFDWPARPRADGLELRACHGVDIPFTFGTFDVEGWDAFVGSDTDPQGAGRLSAALRAAWCSFARTGDPAHEGIGPWTRYTAGDRPMMRLGHECGIEVDLVAARLDALAAAGITP